MLTVSPNSDFAFPLSEFYARSSFALPRMEIIPGDAVPAPYRPLLVHERDMTSTLERFHASEIYIKALSSERRDGGYFREVLLCRASDDAPVEFGANCIDLARFTPEARWMILQEKVPLGRIGHVEECVEAILFMARASYITGETIPVGGGLR